MLLEPHSFAFGEFVFDTREKVLLQKDIPVPVPPKVLDLLLVLLQNHGHIVEKEKLMKEVWANSFVEESNLTYSIRQLRKIFGDNKLEPRFIETVPRRGYRFVAQVDEVPQDNGQRKIGRAIKANPSENGWRTRPVFYSIGLILALASLLTAGFFVSGGDNAQVSPVPARNGSEYPELKITALTNSDTPITAAISPDGKNIAYTSLVNGQQSLWLRQLSSGVNTQIVSSETGVIFHSVEFSGNGESVYFTRRYKNEPTHLDRVSILGGTIKAHILDNLDGTFSISPDESQISFRRYEPQRRSLRIANIDGGNERTLVETSKSFTDNVFSPDGKTIAFASGQSNTGNRDFGVYTVDIESGIVRSATDVKWFHVSGVLWLPDQSGLLVTGGVIPRGPQQLWLIAIPGGEVTKVTNGQDGFTSMSATRDLNQILLAQTTRSSMLYITGPSATHDARPVADAFLGVAYTPGGDVIYTSSGADSDLWLLEADKTNPKQLTTGEFAESGPRASPDGRYIVFTSDRAGRHNVWRINADGNDLTQLTNGGGEQAPVFTPDGKFVVYNSMKDVSLWKVSIGGGEPSKISDTRAYKVSISPDGTRFAHVSRGDDTKVVVKSLDSAEVLQEFEIPGGLSAGNDVVWTGDGNALVYNVEDGAGTGNLWKQFLSGGAPQKLTDFDSDEIFAFDFSPDGSQLALVRGSWGADVVLLEGLKSIKPDFEPAKKDVQ